MTFAGGEKLRALLQEFVDARLDVPELFARAGKLLPAGADTSEEILELLAEADLKLRLPAGRGAFVRRLEQFAAGQSSYTELDLWRSEERRVGKSVDLGGRRIIKKKKKESKV